MSVTFNGKPPVVVVPAPKLPIRPITPPSIDLKATKGVFVGVLAASRQTSASDALEDATFSLVGYTLEIQTALSSTMLPVVVNPEAVRLMESALIERGAANIKIRLLAAPTKEAKSGSAPSPTLSASLKKLAESAEKLNKVSDELTIQIELIDREFKRLNLGVTAWVTISESTDEDGNWTNEQLGYTRIGNRWGVALRSLSGMRGDPNDPHETFSGFADAPRQLRIRAIQHIPELIEKLSVEAEAMIAKLSPKVDEITQLTHALLAVPEVKK